MTIGEVLMREDWVVSGAGADRELPSRFTSERGKGNVAGKFRGLRGSSVRTTSIREEEGRSLRRK